MNDKNAAWIGVCTGAGVVAAGLAASVLPIVPAFAVGAAVSGYFGLGAKLGERLPGRPIPRARSGALFSLPALPSWGNTPPRSWSSLHDYVEYRRSQFRAQVDKNWEFIGRRWNKEDRELFESGQKRRTEEALLQGLLRDQHEVICHYRGIEKYRLRDAENDDATRAKVDASFGVDERFRKTVEQAKWKVIGGEQRTLGVRIDDDWRGHFIIDGWSAPGQEGQTINAWRRADRQAVLDQAADDIFEAEVKADVERVKAEIAAGRTAQLRKFNEWSGL